MSELEPTSTELEPTATERLRALLTERGVEYRWDTGTATWYVDGVMYNAWGYDNERLTMSVCHLTPEQAIAATLGQEDIYTRDDMEGAFVSGYSLGSLPVGSDPRWDENRQTVDEHMAELGWVRKESATLGSCNCSNSERTSDVDATGARQGDAGKVYLVEACDELIEGWCPLVAYLSREAAEGHAESLRGEVDGVMSFARVVELKVVTDG